MGSQASIDVLFAESYEPVQVLQKLLDKGFSYNVDGWVEYQNENEDWCFVDYNAFSLELFLEKSRCQNSVSLSLIFENDIGCTVLINRYYLSFLLSINRVYIDNTNLPDFSWYLKRLSKFLSLISVQAIKCDFCV